MAVSEVRASVSSQCALMICVCLSFFSMPVGTAPLTICSLAALAVWLLSGSCCRDRARWLDQEWRLPLFALVLLPWLALLWTPLPAAQAVRFAERSHYWLFAFVAASALTSERTVRNVLTCFVSGTAIIAFIRFLHFHGIISQTTYLHRAFFNSYITFSLLVVIAIALLGYFYRDTSSQTGRFVILVLMIGFVLALTELNGRSGYLALALLSPWICSAMFGRCRLIAILCGLLLLGTLMLTSHRVRERVALVPAEIEQYYQSGGHSESSVGDRLMIWGDALKIFMQHPLVGAGTGAFQLEANRINPANKFPHPHNSYLYIAANFGLLGIVLYGWCCLVRLKGAWRDRWNLSGSSTLAFPAVILIGSLTDTQVLSTATGIALGFVVGIPTPEARSCAS